MRAGFVQLMHRLYVDTDPFDTTRVIMDRTLDDITDIQGQRVASPVLRLCALLSCHYIAVYHCVSCVPPCAHTVLNAV